MKKALILFSLTWVSLFAYSQNGQVSSFGIFDATADWGSPEFPPRIGTYKTPGRVEVNVSEDEFIYDVYGNGRAFASIQEINDEAFYVYTTKRGSWRISGKITWLERGSSSYYNMAGLIIREIGSDSSSRMFSTCYFSGAGLWLGKRADVRWRTEKKSVANVLQIRNERGNNVILPGEGVYFRLTRWSETQTLLAEWSIDGIQWVFAKRLSLDLSDRLAYGICVCNNEDNDRLARVRFSHVSIEPAPPIAERILSPKFFRSGDVVHVTLNVYNSDSYPQTIEVRDAIDRICEINSISHGGRFEKNSIEWKVEAAPGLTKLTYSITPANECLGAVQFSGAVGSQPILGDNFLAMSGAIFDRFADWGLPEFPPKYSRYKEPGSVNITQQEDSLLYDLWGNGEMIFDKFEEGFYIYTERSGSWTLTAKIQIPDQSNANELGLITPMIREHARSSESKRFNCAIQCEGHNRNAVATIHWRQDLVGFVSDSKFNWDLSLDREKGIYIRVSRDARHHVLIAEYSYDGFEWFYACDQKIEMQDSVAYGIAVSCGRDGHTLFHARLSDVSLEPMRPYALRILSEQRFDPFSYTSQASPISVILETINPQNTTQHITLTENIPEFWLISDLPDDVTQMNRQIQWQKNLLPGATYLKYTIKPNPQRTFLLKQAHQFSGKVDTMPIGGTMLLKPKILINDIVLYSIFCIVPLTMLILHLSLSVLNLRVKQNLFFTLYLIVCSGSSLIILVALYPESPWFWDSKFETFTYHLQFLILLLFFYSFVFSKILKRYWLFFAGSCLSIYAILSVPFNSYYGSYQMSINIIVLGVILLEIIHTVWVAILRQMEGVWMIALGVFFLSSITIWYIFSYFGLISEIPILAPVTLGHLLFMLMMSVLYANRFARTQNELSVLNIELEDRVERRTHELSQVNDKLQQTNEYLNEANEQLRQLDQMKSQFVSQASHDLRTPLTAIKGSLDNLLMGIAGDLNEKQTKVMERATKSVDRLTNLINDVLDLNRIETGRIVLEKTDIPFKTLVENIIHENRPAAEQKQIKLSFDTDEGDYTLHIDGGKIERIVGELVSNAIKYTPEKGMVDVRLSQDYQQISLSVKDSGIGMTPEECEKIWERFYRTASSKKFAKGSGLGLSIAKELVELHGGALTVESEVEKGATFMLSLSRKGD